MMSKEYNVKATTTSAWQTARETAVFNNISLDTDYNVKRSARKWEN